MKSRTTNHPKPIVFKNSQLPHPTTIFVKKNFTDFVHLFYWNEEFFDHEYIRNLREDRVRIWNQLQSWEGSTNFFNLVSNDFVLENDHPKQVFDHLTRSSFTSFFSSNLIDVPKCFKGISSLYRQSHTLPIIKFTNLLMRKGFKERVFGCLSRTATRYMNEHLQTHFLLKTQSTGWSNVFLTFNTFHISTTNHGAYMNKLSRFYLNDLHLLHFDEKHNNVNLNFSELFFSYMPKIAPTFNFYVYKVNKSKRKNSRGKTGKYTIIWKYIAPFKRLYLTFRWLLRDLKFQKARNFEERCYKLWQMIATNLLGSFAAQVKNFSHKFVFQNYRRTLMSSLRACL